jgi:hypothetical protein
LEEAPLRQFVRCWLDNGDTHAVADAICRSTHAVKARSTRLRERLAIADVDLLAWRIGTAIDGTNSAEIHTCASPE